MSDKISRTVITIDGLAASGKSTLAKLLAKELGFLHVNTGLLYRACALLAIENNVSTEDKSAIVSLLSKHQLSFEYTPETGSILLIDSKDRSNDLLSLEVATFTSKIAAIPEVRAVLKQYQKEAFALKNIVAEGRDLGTVIFPNAAVKFFVKGDPLIRASRRARELKGQLTEEELQRVTLSVAEELKERDDRDSQREVAPLKPAPDAEIIDNSKGELVDTVKKMMKIVKSKVVL